jgi:predicted enzyme related to lactoylglutathione lyase
VITGIHALIYSDDAQADRAFLRDVFGWRHVDSGDGWLIFALPPAELGVHPTMPGSPGGTELYLMCDDVQATVRELTERGVEFAGEVTDAGFGLLVSVRLPSGGTIGLYEPRHQVAIQT